MPRAGKNAVEREGARAAHRRDAVAMARFLAWFAQTAPQGGLTEISAADQLLAFRREVEHFRGESFSAISGAGENGADEMGAFVSACDIVRHHIGGAVLGVHHSGKDKEKGMRGSTVLLGACDGVIRVTKDGELVTLKTEKQKDAEESAPIYMRMKKVSWPIEGDEWQSTLVPFLTVDRPVAREEMSSEQVTKAFEILSTAWNNGRPLSTAPQVRNQGRYAPSILSKELECSEKLVAEYLTSWLENDCLSLEMFDTHGKVKGLRVINSILPGASK